MENIEITLIDNFDLYCFITTAMKFIFQLVNYRIGNRCPVKYMVNHTNRVKWELTQNRTSTLRVK